MQRISSLVAAAALLCGAASAQQHTQVRVLDSQSLTEIPDAVVTELTTGQTTTTDAAGHGFFAQPLPLGVELQFQVAATGFPVHSFERISWDAGADAHGVSVQVLALTQANEVVSPLVGPAGGSRAYGHATEELVPTSATDPTPTPYVQQVRATIPPGALAGNYRVGFSLVSGLGWAENLLNLAPAGASVLVAGQIRIQWLDPAGQPAAPVLAAPFRLEMAPSTHYLAAQLPGAYVASLRRFDPGTLTWVAVQAPHGMAADGTLWADITDSGEYAFVLDPAPGLVAPLCNVRWNSKPWQGPALVSETLLCPVVGTGGTQTTGSVTKQEEEGTELSLEISAETSGILKKLGFKASASGAGTRNWTCGMQLHAGYTPGMYPMMEGTVAIHEVGFELEKRKICVDAETGVVVTNILLHTAGPFITGLKVITNLTPCP